MVADPAGVGQPSGVVVETCRISVLDSGRDGEWDNPFECDDEIRLEFNDPASLFRSGQLDDDYQLI